MGEVHASSDWLDFMIVIALRHVLRVFHGDDSSINFGCEVAFFIRPDVTDVQSGCCNVPRSTPPAPSTRPFHNALQWRTKSSGAGRRSNEDEGCIAKVDEITFFIERNWAFFRWVRLINLSCKYRRVRVVIAT